MGGELLHGGQKFWVEDVVFGADHIHRLAVGRRVLLAFGESWKSAGGDQGHGRGVVQAFDIEVVPLVDSALRPAADANGGGSWAVKVIGIIALSGGGPHRLNGGRAAIGVVL